MIGGAGKADFSGKACINNNYESTMLDFSDDNNLIAGNQVDAGSASYYYQVDGLYDISSLTVFYEQVSPKASYISDHMSIIL